MTKDEIADVTRLALGDRIRVAVKFVLRRAFADDRGMGVGAVSVYGTIAGDEHRK